ncbi:YdcF family protein [Muribacter muris]|uniref:YdcF family protein n=1 Tax=Muribacter muris TaxID=67855 RepID=A0A4Y9JW39_9PAST|nr:YdcF family protein [Muribacter muris]MBF0785307.1 YdcF family protein [Muribacter muris]MBF0826321.1 YdcF family protein [Muribacter muris]TFV09708.1 YdcF family protein [Muribacter muris]
MFVVTKIITAIILPPFNVLILWLMSLWFFRLNWKKLAYVSSFLGIAILYIFSLPYTSQKLHDSLVTEDNLTLDDYRSAQAIVLLGGGLRDSKELFGKLAISEIAFERVRYAAYLQKHTQLPLLITGSSPNGTSEAAVMANELKMFFQIPTEWIEGKAKTTKENAQFSRAILEKAQVRKIILVTNQWHMQRAKLLFEREGFEVLPASVGGGITPSTYGLTIMHFLPASGALHSNVHALKEWIGYWKEK